MNHFSGFKDEIEKGNIFWVLFGKWMWWI